MCFELFNHLHLCLRRLLPTISLTSRQLGDFLIFCKNGGSKFGTFTLYTSWNFRMVRQLKGIPWEWGDFAVVSVGQVIYDCERMLMGCQTSKWPWAVGGEDLILPDDVGTWAALRTGNTAIYFFVFMFKPLFPQYMFKSKIYQNQDIPPCIVRCRLGSRKTIVPVLLRELVTVGVFQGTFPAIFFVHLAHNLLFSFGKFYGNSLVVLWELSILRELSQGHFWILLAEVFPLATERASMHCKFTTTIQLRTLVSATAVACAWPSRPLCGHMMPGRGFIKVGPRHLWSYIRMEQQTILMWKPANRNQGLDP